MGKFDGVLLCTDFDGTLSWVDGVPPENVKALNRFMDQGGWFTVSSGRYAYSIKEACRDFLPNAPLISLNGSMITDGDKVLFRGFLRDRIYTDISTMLSACPEVNGVRLYSDHKGAVYEANLYDPEVAAKAVPEPCKVILTVPTEHSDGVTAALHRLYDQDYWLGRSWPNGIEIQEKDCSKGMAVKRLKEYLQARVLICVGDYENDLPMIQAADIGYAMGNAVPMVKEAAHRITLHCKDGGVAAMVEELEREFS